MKTENTAETAAHDKSRDDFEQAKQSAQQAYIKFMESKEHLKAAAQNVGAEFRESANEQVAEAMEKWNEKQQAVMKEARAYIKKNPISSAGMAFLGGMLVSRLLGK